MGGRGGRKTKIPKINGRTPKNTSEVRCYNWLRDHIPNDMKVTYEDETIPYTILSTYKPDFRVSFRRNDDTVAYVEFKGNGRAFSSDVRKKMIAIKDQNPDRKFYLVFYADGKIGPKRKDGSFMRQSDWAVKNGYEFCVGVENIPEYWFDPEYKGENKMPTLKDKLREENEL